MLTLYIRRIRFDHGTACLYFFFFPSSPLFFFPSYMAGAEACLFVMCLTCAIRQHTSAYVIERVLTYADVCHTYADVCHTLAYVSIRHRACVDVIERVLTYADVCHTYADVCPTSAYVSIRHRACGDVWHRRAVTYADVC